MPEDNWRHAAPEPDGATVRTPGTGSDHRRPSLRVVVADDNPVVRAGLTALLDGRDDIRVVADAADGGQALLAAERYRPDVVLLDVRMPGVDGLSALPRIARIAPVLMLTYSRESETVGRALRLGAGGYLVHGEFTAEQLIASVRDITEGGAPLTSTAASALVAHVRRGPVYETVDDASAHGWMTEPEWRERRKTVVQGPQLAEKALLKAPNRSDIQRTTSQAQSRMGESTFEEPFQERLQERLAERRAEHGLSHREVEVMDLIASGMSNQQIAATCFISEKTVKNHINRIFAKLGSASRSEAILVWLGPIRQNQDSGRGRA